MGWLGYTCVGGVVGALVEGTSRLVTRRLVQRSLRRLLHVLQVHLIVMDPQVWRLDVARSWLPRVTFRISATQYTGLHQTINAEFLHPIQQVN